MVHCQMLQQEDSTEVSPHLLLFIVSELNDKKSVVLLNFALVEAILHLF